MKINKLILLSIGLFVFVVISYFLFIHYGAEFKLSKQVDYSNQLGISKATQDLLDHPSSLIQKMTLLGKGEASSWKKLSDYEWHSTSKEYQFGTKNKFEYVMNGFSYELQGSATKCNKIVLDLRIRNKSERVQALTLLDRMTKQALHILSMNQIDTLHQSIMNAKEYKYKHQGLTIQLAHLPSRAEFWQLSISRYE